MRKLTAQFLAFALAIVAYTRFADQASARSLWLSSFLALATLLVFALASGPLPPQPLQVTDRTWSTVGRAMTLAAALLAFVSAIVVHDLWLTLGVWTLFVLLFIIGLYWPDRRVSYERPAYKWTTDSAGNWVRAALGVDERAGDDADVTRRSSRRLLHIATVLILAIGVFLRLWRLMDSPSGCVLQECNAALLLANQPPIISSLSNLLAALLYSFTQNALLSLRLTGALIGVATLPLFYWSAHPFSRTYGAALATMMLALAPWHIWISRTSDPGAMTILLIILVAGIGVRAYRTADSRWWGGLGFTLGLLLLETRVAMPSLLWAIAVAAIALWLFLSTSTRRLHLPAAMLALGCGAAVALLPAWRLLSIQPLQAKADLAWTLAGWQTSLAYLFGGSPIGFFTAHPLLGVLPFALALLGIGQLFRSVMRPYAAMLAAGFIAYLAAYLLNSDGAALPVSTALTLLPFVFIAAAVSTETLISSFYHTWRPLISARTVIILALLAVLIPSAWHTVSYIRGMDDASVRVNRSVDESIARHIANCLSEQTVGACVYGTQSADNPTPFQAIIYAPKDAVEHPTTRLLLGNNANAERVRVFDVARDLPPSPVPSMNVLYLVPIDDHAAISLLREFYPNAETYALPADEGATQFVSIAVYQADLLQRQGLEGLYFEGTQYGAQEEAAFVQRDGPLTFAWSSNPPLDGALSVTWEGSLQAPASGVYRFMADLPADAADSSTVFTLQLDDRLVLDSSLGLLEKEEVLAQGFYRLTMRYRSERPQDWALQWQTPGSELAVIPRDALYSPALPDIGLIGTYYAGNGIEGPVLTSRKDLILSNIADLPQPYTVVWEGKLAAPRAESICSRSTVTAWFGLPSTVRR